MRASKQYVLAALLGVLIGLALYAVAHARTRYVKQDPPPQRELITSAPEVISCVKNIKVVSKEIRSAGTPNATVAVEVENTGKIGITAISIEISKGRESYGVLTSTFEAYDPIAVIEPRATATLTMAVSNIYPGVPLQIGSVAYIDGTEEGCESSLKAMRDSKKMHQANRAKRKGSPSEARLSALSLSGGRSRSRRGVTPIKFRAGRS